MMLTGLFVKMSNGANYSVVPFVNKRALGAGGGDRRRGWECRRGPRRFSSSLTYPQAFLILGVAIALCSPFALALRFSETDELVARREMEARLTGSFAGIPAGSLGD